MFKNYFKTAVRNLSRNRAYSLINIFGLTLGIASCLVIFLVVKYELGYDKFHTKSDRIYRVTLNAIDFNPSVSMGIAPAMRNDFPELEAVSQVWYRQNGIISIDQRKFEEKKYAFADKYFTSVFDYNWVKGNSKTALTEPNSLVLTESTAKKYFGDADPIGKLVKLDNKYDLKVTGLIKDVPGNTHLPFDFLISLETVRQQVESMNYFYSIPGGAFCYIVTPKNLPIATIQKRIFGFVKKNWGEDMAKEARLPLQPLTDIHFDQRYLNSTISYTTSRETYYALTAIAVLIIIIACINFINLATAQAIRRAKEVGVRKVLGSGRSQLITQFLGETSVLVFAAVLLSVVITVLFLPKIAGWLDINIDVSQLSQPSVIGLVLLTALAIILLAGLYPAFVQSAFKPTESLKSKANLSLKGLTLRKSLVVFQFAISQIMIVGTLVVAYQMDFFQNRNLGFDKDAVISFVVPDNKADVFKQELAGNPGITAISFSSGAPGISNNYTDFSSPENGFTKGDVTEVKFIDENYTDMFGLKMLAGKKIMRAQVTPDDTIYNAVVNETLINKLGIQDPQKAIGKHIVVNGGWQVTITGVVRDFQSESKHKKIRSCVIIYRPDIFFMASVKVRMTDFKKTISAIDKSWSAMFPQGLFSYEFLDDRIASWYRQEQKEYTAFKLFAGIAILIGCLGLYGLVAFAAAQRVKEVGIRKVLGASVADIVVLFSKEFVVLIAIAFVIAAPVAWYFMNNWLQGFAYQVSIGPMIFIISIISSFLIAAGTIAYQAIKAGVTNPVKSLRTE